MLKHQRELTLPRLTAAPTATNFQAPRICLTLQFLWRQVVKRRFRAAIRALIVTRRIQNFIQGLRAELGC